LYVQKSFYSSTAEDEVMCEICEWDLPDDEDDETTNEEDSNEDD
jgi:hypothetical protein